MTFISQWQKRRVLEFFSRLDEGARWCGMRYRDGGRGRRRRIFRGGGVVGDGGGGRAFIFCNSGSGKSGGRRGAVLAYFKIAGGVLMGKLNFVFLNGACRLPNPCPKNSCFTKFVHMKIECVGFALLCFHAEGFQSFVGSRRSLLKRSMRCAWQSEVSLFCCFVECWYWFGVDLEDEL